MTRWIQEFDQHPFKATWETLLTTAKLLDVDDQTVSTTVEELGRLKKVLAFVDGLIANADIELTPKSVWGNSDSQADACLQQIRLYEVSRNAAHLVQANEHADNLLTYVRPYMVLPEHALKALGIAQRAFSNQISQYVESFQKRTSVIQANLTAALNESVKKQQAIEAIEQRAKQFDDYLFEGVGGNNPAESYVKEMVSDVEGTQKQVAALHKVLFEGPESTSEKITIYANEIHALRDSLSELLGSTTTRDSELQRFYEQIFGRRMANNEEIQEPGLKRELEVRLEQLGAHEVEQKTRQDALFESIESLLPGATSAGLASTYKKLKEKFNIPIISYTLAFYVSMLILFLGGLVLIAENFTLTPFHVEFVKTSDWEEMLRTLLTRVPIILPVIWVAIFSATRRSQYERLQQEYAHKEAFASSYESYKKQLQALKIDADVLQKELLSKAIDAISFNASRKLDGKHTEKLPVQQLLEKISIDEFKKLLDLAKK